MRVLLIGNFLSRHTGVRGVCEELAEQFEASGLETLRTSTRKRRLARLLDMIWTIRRRRTDYDVAQIDLFGGSALLWGEAAARTLASQRKPYVVTLHGGSLPEVGDGNIRRLRQIMGRASKVTAPSSYLARELRTLREDIEVLPNGLDLELYPFRSREAPSPNLVWLRAFHEIYQPELAVRCLQSLLHEYPQARLTMAGPDKGGGSLQAVRRLVQELGLEDQVNIEGPVPKERVGHSIARGDIFLNTSRIDNAPVTVVEAMACGLCVVSTRAGGLADLVRDGETGLLVSDREPAALAEAVQRILSEPGLAGRLSTAGRAEAERFDWKRIVPRWKVILQEAATAAA